RRRSSEASFDACDPPSALPQQEPLDLAAFRLGKVVQELDLARSLMAPHALLHHVDDLVREPRSGGGLRPQDDVGLHDVAASGIRVMAICPTIPSATSRPSSSTTAMRQPGSGRPIEPGRTSISIALQFPIGSPNSLEPYWSMTVTPHARWKNVTTSAFSGSPQ